MTPHLFILTIGPVQSFIAQARKTHDLFSGSALLGSLCLTGIEAAKREFKDENCIVTPAYKDKNGIGSSDFLPNRFLAKITGQFQTEALKQAGKNIEKTIKNEFTRIAIDNLSDAGLGYPDYIKNQIENHLNIEWLFVPITDGYDNAYRKLIKELAAIKTVSQFDGFAETGRKCNVDGERNVVVYREKELNEKRYKLYTESVKIVGFDKENAVKAWELQPGEGLSSVSLVKRKFLGEPHKFPSTVKIALLDLLHEAQAKKVAGFEKLKELVEGEGNKKAFPHSNDQLYIRENIPLICKKWAFKLTRLRTN